MNFYIGKERKKGELSIVKNNNIKWMYKIVECESIKKNRFEDGVYTVA